MIDTSAKVSLRLPRGDLVAFADRLMFDHVTIRVPDRAASERFFAAVLLPLGVDATLSTRSFAVWDDFMVSDATEEHPATHGLDVAFRSPSREQVGDFWQAGIEAGQAGDEPPGPRPRYGEGIYGAALRDPDGNRVEAVHREAPPHRDGIVEHLRIRVADLTAAIAFYRIVAAAAGFELRHEDPKRAWFAGHSAGGSFSLVPGPPTANLHVAFPGDDDAVRRFYDDAIAGGYRGNGEPGERPRYHPGYYAAYALDPDGNNIEVVDHHRP
jgi:catechol 2,3-dioxygenase-like lactoylglutathione lyase family enzyme